MANTRQSIVDALETRLAAVDGVNLAAVWHVSDLATGDLPAVLIRDTQDEMPEVGIDAGRRDHKLSIEIEALAKGATALAAVRELIADIIAAIGTDYTFGGLAYDTQVATADVNLVDSATLIASAQLTLTIRYRTALWAL